MRQKFLVVSTFVLAVVGVTTAQQDKLITHFMYDKMSINPGETGMDGGRRSICGVAMYRNQWDKVSGAPNSSLLNVEANLGHIHPLLSGLGLNFYHDEIGFTRQNNLALNYSYHLSTNFGEFGIGVGLGMVNVGLNPEWVPPSTYDDASLPAAFSNTKFDMNFGVYYKHNNIYAGISSTHLTQSRLETKEDVLNLTSYNTARHYYIMGGYKFPQIGGSNGDLDLNVLTRTDFVKFSADINARYIWNQKAYGGLSYRVSDAVSVMLGYMPIRNMTVGYAYDITVNKLSSISRGTHEIMLKYCYYLPPIPLQTTKHPRWL
jgi:type IX secretion system PorP/SprF family membrane protein